MKSYLYVSLCTYGPFAIHDIEIMRKSLEHNSLHGLTGFLHRSRTHYFQYLEGPEKEVDRLVHRISLDPRNVAFTPIHSKGIASRRFEGWSMGYSADLNGANDKDVHHQSDATTILAFLKRSAERQARELALKENAQKVTGQSHSISASRTRT